ncbi:MAG: hypothetical protein QOD65_286, partial [Gaiellales bacterium]|nr:hypothetical protein [Gaiellales bacterium]
MSRASTTAGAVRVEVPRTRAESKVPARRLRRFGGWLAALLAD